MTRPAMRTPPPTPTPMPALTPVERPESDVLGEVVLLLVSLTSLVEPALGVTSVVMGLAASLVEADGFLSE
jgi:hypothetical protein